MTCGENQESCLVKLFDNSFPLGVVAVVVVAITAAVVVKLFNFETPGCV